jgi:putative transposase
MAEGKSRFGGRVGRIAGRDYRRQGVYFITTVVYKRAKVLGEVRQADVILSDKGRLVAEALEITARRFPSVILDRWIIMPDHVHAIVRLGPENTVSLSRVVGMFKGLSARHINMLTGAVGPFWQRGFHDWVIRSARGLDRCRRYIADNPSDWTRRRSNHSGYVPDLAHSPTGGGGL